MRVRRTLLLAGETVVAAVVTPHVRRRRRTPPPQPDIRPAEKPRGLRWWHVPVVYGTTRMAIDMPDLPSLFLDFWNLGNLIWDQISSIMLTLLEKAFALLVDILNDALNLVDETFERVWGFTEWAGDKIASMSTSMATLATNTWNGVEDAFQNFRQQLTGWLENGYNVIADYVKRLLPDWLEAILGGAWDFLEELIEFGVDGLRMLIDFAGEIGSNGLAMLIDFVRDPIGFIWSLVDDLVDDAIDAALGGFGELLEVLWKIFGILKWLADHVDELSPAKLDEIFSLGGASFLERVVGVFDTHGDDLQAKIAGWIG